LRYTINGDPIQRWLCRGCGYRFSGKKQHSNRLSDNSESSMEPFPGKNWNENMLQVIGLEAKKETSNGLLGATNADIRGKLIQYLFWMQKQRYSNETIRLNQSCLRALLKRDAKLLDPESVKETLAKEKAWGENRKRNIVNAYTLFLKLNGLIWEKPRCHVTQKIPFMPKEEEIDALIAGSGKKTATFLRLLKETGMRSGEAMRLQSIDIDIERNIVILNAPEKGSNPRMWKVTPKLIAMLNALPRKSEKVFGDGPITSMKTTFLKARKRLAAKLQNPRLLQISFHTLRHWKGTMLYHQRRDIHYVQHFLGHKSIKSTEIYINIEHTLFESASDEFTVKVVEQPEDVKALLENGFEWVGEKDNLIFLRKRK
jgi:integrase